MEIRNAAANWTCAGGKLHEWVASALSDFTAKRSSPRTVASMMLCADTRVNTVFSVGFICTLARYRNLQGADTALET